MTIQEEKIIVVIVHYNSNGQLVDCVRSIIESGFEDIIVVDNNSIDGTLEKCREKYKELFYIENFKNIGFAPAVNIGVKKAMKSNATHILLCNPDALVENTCIKKLIKESNNKIGIYSPLIYNKKDDSIWFAGGYINYKKQLATHETVKELPRESYYSEYISGCVMLVNVQVFQKIGFLDERFFLYYEDVDFSIRVQKAGFCTKLVPSAIAFHDEQSKELGDKKIYFLVLAGLKFFEIHTPASWRLQWFMYTLIRFSVSFIKYKLKKPHSKAVWCAFKDYVYRGKKHTNFISNS